MPRGGAREGAGRKPKEGGAKKLFACRIKAENKNWIEDQSKTKEQSAGEFLDEIIDGLRGEGE